VVLGFIPESQQLNATNPAILAFSFISAEAKDDVEMQDSEQGT
jgi:hypothetical protein